MDMFNSKIFFCHNRSTNSTYTYIHLSHMTFRRWNWKKKLINNEIKIQVTGNLEKKHLTKLKHFRNLGFSFPNKFYVSYYFQKCTSKLCCSFCWHKIATLFFQHHHSFKVKKIKNFSLFNSPSNFMIKHTSLVVLGVYQLYILLHLLLPVSQQTEQH
jgi:hypothetical protein